MKIHYSFRRPARRDGCEFSVSGKRLRCSAAFRLRRFSGLTTLSKYHILAFRKRGYCHEQQACLRTGCSETVFAYVIAYFHSKMEFMPGPTVSVQIFFMISGFFLAKKFYARSCDDHFPLSTKFPICRTAAESR